jgi:hypothetical protein
VGATLQKIRSERRKYFQQLLGQMKLLDGRQELVQRYLRSCLNRKKGYIDSKDLDLVRARFTETITEANKFASQLGKGFVE